MAVDGVGVVSMKYSCDTCINQRSARCNDCKVAERMGKRVGIPPTHYEEKTRAEIEPQESEDKE